MVNRLLIRMTVVASSVAMVLGLAIPSIAISASAAEALAPVCGCDAQALTCVTDAYNNFQCCSPAAMQRFEDPTTGAACDSGPTTAAVGVPPGGNPGAACVEQLQGAVSRCSVQYFICDATCGLGRPALRGGRGTLQ